MTNVTDVSRPSTIRQHAAPLFLLLACSVAAILPLLLHGPSCGHDFDFHLLSWIETAHDWHHHLLNPQWLATANYGAGEPRFIFYPPVSWVLGATVGVAASVVVGQTEGWTLAPIFITFFAIFSAGICVYALAKALASRIAALIAACLFIANPYMLFVAYERAAYGELLATPLIALLLLLALRKILSIPALAIVVAGLWLTNAPAAVMGCYTLAFICLLRLARERDWFNAARAASACGLGLGLAGFYLLPAAYEQRWVQIGRAVATGMRVQDSFLFRYTGEGYHDQVLRTASILTVILIAIGFMAFAAICLRKQLQPSVSILGSLLAVILFLQFHFSLGLWHAAPHLQFLQFPWRWLLVASIVSACLVAMALSRTSCPKHFQVAAVFLTMIVVIGSIRVCSKRFTLACDEQDVAAGQLASFHNGAGVQGTDEYVAIGADNSAIFQDTPQVRLLTIPDAEEPDADAGDNPEWPGYSLGAIDSIPGSITINQWEPESRTITLTTKQPAFAVLTLMDYPAWKVSVNGHPVAKRPKRDDGLMAVPVEAGKSVVTVHWSNSADILWGRALSAIALVILVLLVWSDAGAWRSRS